MKTTQQIFTIIFLLFSSFSAQAKIDDILFREKLLSLRADGLKKWSCSDDVFTQLRKTPDLEISIVFGYNDQRPYLNVLDGQERETLEKALLLSCESETDRLCGFKKENPNELVKWVKNEKGVSTRISVRLFSSSVTGHDEWNRNQAKEAQYKSSVDTEKNFVRALSDSKVVFYLGHARNGGGPDFYPPKLKENGQVYLRKYEAEQRGLGLLKASLKKTRSLQVLGLFACDADDHFTKTLTSTRKDISYILAKDVTLPSLMDYAMWGALHSLLGKTCPPQLEEALAKSPTGQKPAPFRFIKAN